MIELILQLSGVALVLAILLALLRLVQGPTVLDRILAFDTITVCVVGLIILLSIEWDTPFFLELILVVSLLGFISGVAFIFYLEKAMETRSENPPPPGTPNPPRSDSPPKP
jgi:multisubunit Na+/H+ antiporter MnhF subunit